ncbi:hypothetical protein MMC30_001376 [Trapelia coarctata]|nr:hypothetical protein [Trapelia coarctata]
MKDDTIKAPDSVDIRLDATEATVDDKSDNVAVASDGASAPASATHVELEAANGLDGETNNGDQRSDSEAETVVLSGKDEASSNVNPKAIKHEGKSGVEAKTVQAVPDEATKDAKQTNSEILDRKKAPKIPSTTAAGDASYSSNLSSTASSPAQEKRSSSKGASEPDHSRSEHLHDGDAHPKDIVSRKRKLRVEDTDEKIQQRRRKRATSSETANNSDRRDPRKVSKGRSESPPMRSRHRAQSTQSVDPQSTQKRRKPPPLHVGQRRKASEDVYAESDDSGSANGIPQLRKLVSTDNVAMSPVKMPHKKHRDKNGRTWLARACALDDIENARARLQERPEDIDIPDHAGNTPLQIASLEGSADIVKMLLDAGCDNTCKNVDGDTPLIDAVENGHLEVVSLLLAAGLDPRQSNAKGEAPLDLLKPSNDNYEEIKAALEYAKGQYTGRRLSEDQHAHPSTARDNNSAHSPRASPSLNTARSPPPHGQAPRRTARSESTRNDLLWINPTPEELRKHASNGSFSAVNHILNMRPIGDTEAVLLAAKGGHKDCLSLMIALGEPEHDPEPLQSGQYRTGQNTPMLAAIGRGNIEVISMLLNQSGFDPSRRLYRNLTYHEIAKERQGASWQEEYNILKKAYDSHKANRPKGSSPPKPRTGTSQREAKTRKRDTASPSLLSARRQSPDASKDRIVKKKRSSESRQAHHPNGEDAEGRPHGGSHNRLRVPHENSRESSVVVSDREATPLVKHKEKKRSFSDAGISVANDRDVSKPKKRLVSSRVLKEDEEKKRRASLASSSSSQEHVRKNSGSGQKGSVISRHESKEGAKLSPPETLKKRSFQSISPSDGNSAGLRRASDAPKRPKRQRVNSIGNALDREPTGRLQSGPAKVANMISPPVTTPATQSQGAAPVAFMGNSSTSPIKERTNPFLHRIDADSPMTDTAIEVLPHISSVDMQIQGGVGDEQNGEIEQGPARSVRKIKDEVDDSEELEERREREERQEREWKLMEQMAKEQAAREEADRVAREAEEARLEEQRRVEAAERNARLEREAEEARIEKKRQEEEAQLRLIEREKQRKEEMERRRVEQEERERLIVIRRREEEERRRRESLPNALRIAAELSPDSAKNPNEILRWLPLYTAFGHQLDPQCEEPARDERWITNIQAAPILAITDLDLSQCKSALMDLFSNVTKMAIDTAWTKRPITESHREALWRVLRVKLTRYERQPGIKYDIQADLAMVEETHSKYSALEHIFWIKLSDFMDIVPRYPHLNGIPLNCGPLALVSFGHPSNEFQHGPIPVGQWNGHSHPITNGELTNGYH